MNALALLGKPHKLPFELYDPYLEFELEIENLELERDLSPQIESTKLPIVVAYYDIIVMESEVEETDDSFRDSQSLVD